MKRRKFIDKLDQIRHNNDCCGVAEDMIGELIEEIRAKPNKKLFANFSKEIHSECRGEDYYTWYLESVTKHPDYEETESRLSAEELGYDYCSINVDNI